MAKIRRNDPCSCGSGLKYKKCCGKNNVISFNPLQLNQELIQLHDNLLYFTFTNYEKAINDITYHHIIKYLNKDNDDNYNSYASLILPWILLNKPVSQNQTVFELFLKQQLNQVKSEKVKNILSSWGNAPSSVFKINSIDSLHERKVMIEDMTTNKVYRVIYEEVREESIGDFILGTIIPLIDTNIFLYSVIEVHKEGETLIKEVLDRFDLDEFTMREIYPSFIGKIIEPYEDDLVWPKPIHEEVAQQFSFHMDQKNVDANIIYSGILFWNHYCLEHNPSVIKTSTYAAALDYFICLVLLDDVNVTQAALAKEYNVSMASISTHYQKFIDELEQTPINDALLNDNTVGMEKKMDHLQKLYR